MHECWEVLSQHPCVHKQRVRSWYGEGNSFFEIYVYASACRYAVGLDIHNEDFPTAVAAPPTLDNAAVGVTQDRGVELSRSFEPHVVGIDNISPREVVKISHSRPAREGRVAAVPSAPTIDDLIQALPFEVSSNTMGSGLFAFGSSIVTKNFLPFTFSRLSSYALRA
jgi:hypothetical protein